MKKGPGRFVRVVALAAGVFAVGVAGVWVGTLLRERVARGQSVEVSARAPRSLLHAGDAFPDVALEDAAGNGLSTTDLLANAGGVVLFIDLECPPCTDMCLRWQRAIDAGVIPADQVIGVTNQTTEVAETYRSEHGLRFDIYHDPGGVFRHEYDVSRFPLEVVVGESGRVRSTSYESASDVDTEALARQLAD